MKIAVTWEMCGFIDVPEADNIEDAIREVSENADDYDLPSEAVYVDGSFVPSTYDVETMKMLCELEADW